MNTGFYKDLDTNFELALEMATKELSQDELLKMLQNGNIPEKQLAALELNSINNETEANILVENLTGCDGKIREAVALKINSLLNENPQIADLFNQAEVFANASIDINGNICRLVIDSVAILKSNIDFKNKYLSKILSFIDEAYQALDKIIFRDKKYVINKQLFKLYWALEALKLFSTEVEKSILFTILDRASLEREYTIREKAAQIVKDLKYDEFHIIKDRLSKDENYYVRTAISNPAKN